MTTLTAKQRDDMVAMVERYHLALTDGKDIPDRRVHLMAQTAKSLLAEHRQTGLDSFPDMTARQVLEKESFLYDFFFGHTIV